MGILIEVTHIGVS